MRRLAGILIAVLVLTFATVPDSFPQTGGSTPFNPVVSAGNPNTASIHCTPPSAGAPARMLAWDKTNFVWYYCSAINTWTQFGTSTTTGTVTTTGSPANGNLAKFSGATSITNADLTGAVTTSGGVATTMSTTYATRTCQPGLGDGLNAIAAGTYLMSECLNSFGSTFTITSIKCFTDNNGTSTLNVTDNSANALLTGAITCTNAFAAGTQSATTTIASGGFVKWTFVADGTSKQVTFVLTGTL